MKENYQELEIEVIYLEEADIITESFGEGEENV